MANAWHPGVRRPGRRRVICYASLMGAGRNRDQLAAAGWRMLVSPAKPMDTAGMPWCLDNGAWTAFQNEQPWDEAAFERALDRYGPGADFVVLPDIVAGGMASLEMSLRWSNRVLATANLVLIAVQDGMEPHHLAPYVGPQVGIFLGGSTPWKLAQAETWGRFCAERDLWFHFARVNTAKRFRLAHGAGATSIDGSSASRFGKTLPLLVNAAAQPDLYSPRRELVP